MIRYILILATGIFMAVSGWSQVLIGPIGGVTVSDAVFETVRLTTDEQVNAAGGIEITYLPHDRKPGVKLLLSRLSYGFEEITPDGLITYRNTGNNLQFRSYLYFSVRNFRVSVEAGPSISYFNRPYTNQSNFDSALPEFSEGNLNRLMLDLLGGVGLAQPLGKFHVTAHSVFSFSTSKIYADLLGFSNPLSLQIWLGVQYEVFQLPEKRIPDRF